MNRRNEKGFSLLELLIAMMIIAVLGTLGFKEVRRHSAKARHLKALDDLKNVALGLDQYNMNTGKYPDFGSFESMIDANSPLVKGNLIKAGMSPNDPFGQPYEGKSNRGSYELKSLGSPDYPEEFGPITYTPGRDPQIGTGPAAPKAEAGAPK